MLELVTRVIMANSRGESRGHVSACSAFVGAQHRGRISVREGEAARFVPLPNYQLPDAILNVANYPSWLNAWRLDNSPSCGRVPICRQPRVRQVL